MLLMSKMPCGVDFVAGSACDTREGFCAILQLLPGMQNACQHTRPRPHPGVQNSTLHQTRLTRVPSISCMAVPPTPLTSWCVCWCRMRSSSLSSRLVGTSTSPGSSPSAAPAARLDRTRRPDSCRDCEHSTTRHASQSTEQHCKLGHYPSLVTSICHP